MQSNQQTLVLSHPFTDSLIRYKARQLCRRSDFSSSDYDELRQGMRMYLLEKAHLFDSLRGNVEAFVTKALKTWVAMELRYRNRGKRCQTYRAVSLEGTPIECEGDATCLAAVLLEHDGDRLTLVDCISPIEQFELREAIEHVLSHLKPEHRALLASVVERGVTATARDLGVSWRQVANVLHSIRRDFERAGVGTDRRGAGNHAA